jgi:hypothetical protein
MADRPGCARPGVTVPKPTSPEESTTDHSLQPEVPAMTVMVGRPAPDFEAPAYHKGAFTNVKLSDHFGKWTLLCFYPGDFTFV